MKDEEQDRRLHALESDVADIKNVTHGNPLLEWGGIVSEHKKLVASVNTLMEDSAYTKKFFAGFIGLIKTVSIILSLIVTAVAVYNFIVA